MSRFLDKEKMSRFLDKVELNRNVSSILKDYKSEFEEFLKNERAGLKCLTEDGIDKLLTDPNSGFEPGFKGELYEYYIFNLLKRNEIPVLKNASVFRYVTRWNGNGIYFSDGNMDLHGRYKGAFSFFIHCKFRVNNNSLSKEDIEKFLKTAQNNPHFVDTKYQF
ncbi:hypothetical protein C2G38_2027101 [Gigaspora rosea]|uniref:Uncharacterized protein n=1 Tax=Gigaspora rosea TaxID=44941 RepID=A0A397W5Z2_9GLOM|nr:hypothetical protein C2G38_2027101 [Gigaspora rosea]